MISLKCESSVIFWFYITSVVIIFSSVFPSVHACNGGYKLRIEKTENCAGPDPVVKIEENFNVSLSRRCLVRSHGCVEIKGYENATAVYIVRVFGIPVIKGEQDLCAKISKWSLAYPILNTFNFPNKCPVEKTTICADSKHVVNANPFKQFLPLLFGKPVLEINIKHNNVRRFLYQNAS
ncbi:uncharacterized protein LOC129749180 isoform X2 [Uranotaenia lowii]|uniref:uncharacterized protein LOC129749180 isoform X2 n=1 Tax=Uranotaenia lowii TaxID=190385 RepID=UPI002478C612|nr:uncharacterized protein LOC129749180 isoform X2 [Uranotaenia lowii]